MNEIGTMNFNQNFNPNMNNMNNMTQFQNFNNFANYNTSFINNNYLKN